MNILIEIYLKHGLFKNDRKIRLEIANLNEQVDVVLLLSIEHSCPWEKIIRTIFLPFLGLAQFVGTGMKLKKNIIT